MRQKKWINKMPRTSQIFLKKSAHSLPRIVTSRQPHLSRSTLFLCPFQWCARFPREKKMFTFSVVRRALHINARNCHTHGNYAAQFAAAITGERDAVICKCESTSNTCIHTHTHTHIYIYIFIPKLFHLL